MCKTRTRTVAIDVVGFLENLRYMDIDRNYRKYVDNATRSVNRFLKHLGYKHGTKKGSMIYKLKEENRRKRDKYIMKIMTINREGIRRIIYMNESYIHRNYAWHDDSMYDHNDDQDQQVKA